MVQAAGIVKRFPGGVLANDDVSIAVWAGTLHCLVGENGAGKSTLINILYGRYQPEAGRIRIADAEARLVHPSDAIGLGIALVSQHTSLLPALTALENVVLGAEPARAGVLRLGAARERAAAIAARLGVDLPWNAPVEDLSVAAAQKVEIVKALYRGARVLMLDEPTALLAPPEAEALFGVLHRLAEDGAAILLVTHRLREVMAHGERVTVLRGGRSVAEMPVADTTAAELAALMIGNRTATPGVVLAAEWAPAPPTRPQAPEATPLARQTVPPMPALELREVSVLRRQRAVAVRAVTMTVARSEILGVAGVDGSGQAELAEAIAGLTPITSGSVLLEGEAITAAPVAERIRRGLGYLPQDRLGDGVVLELTVAENLLLGRHGDRRYGGGWPLSTSAARARAARLIAERHVRGATPETPLAQLSGGNQQKVLAARATDPPPRVLVAMQPTRGLDYAATRQTYEVFRELLRGGTAILLFSLDLDEILALADRVAVMYAGGIVGVVGRGEATPERIGAMMLQGAAA